MSDWISFGSTLFTHLILLQWPTHRSTTSWLSCVCYNNRISSNAVWQYVRHLWMIAFHTETFTSTYILCACAYTPVEHFSSTSMLFSLEYCVFLFLFFLSADIFLRMHFDIDLPLGGLNSNTMYYINGKPFKIMTIYSPFCSMLMFLYNFNIFIPKRFICSIHKATIHV